MRQQESPHAPGQLNGIVVVNKPEGPSSAQCLVAFKRQGQKKIGHAGTLDPMASGVLIVLLGSATRLSSWLLESGKKIYSGSIRLGLETDTWDITGKTVRERDWQRLEHADIAAEIAAWKRLQSQEVPAYSAAKYKGQPLYKLARKGHDTPVKVKSVRIENAEFINFRPPFADFRVTCGSGVYIRSLAHSLGMRLGCGACLSKLTREYSHPYGIAAALELEEIQGGLSGRHVHSIASALPEWPVIELDAKSAQAARNGMPVSAASGESRQNAILSHNGKELAIASLVQGPSSAMWAVKRGLWVQE